MTGIQFMREQKRERLTGNADIQRLNVFVHYVNRAESGSPQWMPVYYADKGEAEKLPQREETRHEKPDIVAAWFNTRTDKYFDWKDKTKELKVITLGL
jgi:hypothetical protein